jgi:hypothetical protein
VSLTSGRSQGRAASARRQPPRRLLALAIIGGVLGLLVIGALADLFAVTPLHPPTQPAASQRAGLDTLTLTINPEPLTAGQPTAFILHVSDVSGAPVPLASLSCAFGGAGERPAITTAARGDDAGAYTCDATLPTAGVWSLTVTLTAPGASAVHTTFALQAR